MVMSDVLCKAKEEALDAVNPHLFTVATLTGHVGRAFGPGYSAVMDNGPARAAQLAQRLSAAGETWGDPFEISTVRREDFNLARSSYPTEDIIQCNSLPSTMTPRGHQFPGAFMTCARWARAPPCLHLPCPLMLRSFISHGRCVLLGSGLDKHGRDSHQPIPYSHLDIAGR